MVNKDLKRVEMLDNNILVKVDIPDTKTKSGIQISEDVARQVQQTITGEILSIGKDVTKFKIGDEILLPPHGGTAVVVDGDVFHVFRETSIFAKLN